jgi:hypothetical protein
MPKYTVEFKGVAWATAYVEADNAEEAFETAFADGFPRLCAHCSGWNNSYKLEIPDDPAGWEADLDGVQEVRD